MQTENRSDWQIMMNGTGCKIRVSIYWMKKINRPYVNVNLNVSFSAYLRKQAYRGQSDSKSRYSW